MAKVISEAAAVDSSKMVLIKHTRTMKNPNGNDVTVLDYEEQLLVDEAISRAEANKASLEAQLTEVDAELAEYIAIRDAE